MAAAQKDVFCQSTARSGVNRAPRSEHVHYEWVVNAARSWSLFHVGFITALQSVSNVKLLLSTARGKLKKIESIYSSVLKLLNGLFQKINTVLKIIFNIAGTRIFLITFLFKWGCCRFENVDLKKLCSVSKLFYFQLGFHFYFFLT